MASSVVLTIKSDKTYTQNRYDMQKGADKDKQSLQAIINHLKKVRNGSARAVIDLNIDDTAPVAASATATCANVSADDTITIAGVVLTAKASPSGENQWSQAGDNTADAASLASKINAHSVLSKIVSASAASGVVTVTCLTKGIVGNYLTLVSSNGTRLAVTGSGYLANGTGGIQSAAQQYVLGIS